jgi:spore maturation protein CgeB
MRLVVFGLSISSAWGNGHATLLRGLFRALNDSGHQIHFFEKDVPYYASHRDATQFPFVDLRLYSSFADVIPYARKLLNKADAALVTSYCPDGALACDLVLSSRARCKLFYDLDTPVTLLRLEQGEAVPYLPTYGLRDFDLVLSYTGGEAIGRLRKILGARRIETLYGWVDPDLYHPVNKDQRFACDLSYLGTYAPDRQAAFEELFLQPARSMPDRQFVLGGAMYSDAHNWPSNVRHFDHVVPTDHCAFYSSAPLTLSITRGTMAAMGYCPSGRLFEAAACGTAVLSDSWRGLDEFFEPGTEILVAKGSEDVSKALSEPREFMRRIGERARARALDTHTAAIRGRRLVNLIEKRDAEKIVPEWAVRQGA